MCLTLELNPAPVSQFGCLSIGICDACVYLTQVLAARLDGLSCAIGPVSYLTTSDGQLKQHKASGFG